MNVQDHDLIILDGACGTNLQEMTIPASAWNDNEGCNEYLNLSSPETIVAMHSSFVEVGAMVLETNTFGATRVVLNEYGLGNQTAAINRAAVNLARTAINGKSYCYVAGSLGPTTKLPSLGHISYEDMYAAYQEQVRSLLEAGVDLFIIETCQDLMQLKIALAACFDAQQEEKMTLPVMTSITIERTGTMLVGTDIAAATATLEPFPIMSLGLNCATGPANMVSNIRYLSQNWPTRISCIPNQGLPEVVNGKTVYPLSPEAYAEHMHRFVTKYGVSIVGGCCGTTPQHIKALVQSLNGITPGERTVTT